jgi:hypothetical protein
LNNNIQNDFLPTLVFEHIHIQEVKMILIFVFHQNLKKKGILFFGFLCCECFFCFLGFLLVASDHHITSNGEVIVFYSAHNTNAR